ncbi:MAG: hypothetical protein WCL32_21000, partial [Planctomycetota bacterium]
MLRHLLAALALALALNPAFAQTLSDEEAKDGFFNLINGKDFSGWRFSGSVPAKDKSEKAKPFTTVLNVF